MRCAGAMATRPGMPKPVSSGIIVEGFVNPSVSGWSGGGTGRTPPGLAVRLRLHALHQLCLFWSTEGLKFRISLEGLGIDEPWQESAL